MIVGIIIAIIISIVIVIFGIQIYQECMKTWTEILTAFITIIMIVGVLIIGVTIGKSVRNSDLEKDYYGFIAVKQTYDSVISNKKISGLERLEIVKTIIDQNTALARKKVDMNKWYSFDITDENKKLISELQPIGIE